MKKLLLITSLFVFALASCTQMQNLKNDANKSAQKVEKEVRKQEEKMQEEKLHNEAVQALRYHAFVLEADRVIFKRGASAFVSPNTNFVALEDERATVQIALNGPFSGPNGLGGVTVDGSVSNVQMSEDKKGNVTFSMNVSGIGVSAQVVIHLYKEGNGASVVVTPNFNSNRLTLNGKLLPIEKSRVFKGRSI